MESDELSREVRRREQGGTSLGDLVGGEVRRIGARGRRGDATGVWLVWNRVNGDVERAHTTGVHVGEPRRGERDPELTVYVDSAAYLTDFTANREVYLARLETAGLRFSHISFRRSKSRGAAPQARGAREAGAAPLPELTDAERAEIAELCADLPESLRDSVSRAMSASKRAQKREHS